MEPVQPVNPQPTIPPPVKKTPSIKLIATVLVTVALLSAAAYFVYQRFYPSQKTEPQPALSKLTIPCPTDPSFCQNAKDIIKDGKTIGLGANIPPGSPIYAVFDGIAQRRGIIFAPKLKEEPFDQIHLIATPSANLSAVYYLHTSLVVDKSFKKGDIIATVSAASIKYLDNYNLVFTLLGKGGSKLPSEEFDFEK